MKKFLLTSCLCVFAAPVVFAQGSTITIIHEDGSKDVVDLTVIKEVPEPPKPLPVPSSAPEASLGDVIEKTVEPVPAKPAPVKSAPKRAVEPKNPVKTAAKPKEPEERWPPIPPRKPYVSASIAPKAAAATRGYVTREEATHIALNVAPPARDFTVQERGANFAVVFKTGDGDFEVLVDSNNGDVLSKGYLERAVSTPQPGHLPLR